ncbi:hypothetical protein PIB30_101429 [Stylosanthes scabra]|uniref:Uncharacterized protein n=1 Tax=Stylosanthes scabra TaxID=79078 RepID=A0ABU6QWU4_9FABA|nr:hypothetical protein [Stylosanthes scabra]
MSIDDFLAENGIDVENMLETLGLNDDVPFTVPSFDGKDNSVLDANYYQHVMADIDDDKGEPKKKKTCGITTCKDIYARTRGQREEVTFDMDQPVGPTNQINE